MIRSTCNALALTLSLSFTLAFTLAWLGGCEQRTKTSTSASAEQGAAAKRPSSAASEAARAIADERSQYDLAAQIAEAEKMRTDDAAVRLAEIQRSWQGKRYEWKVDVIQPLCKSPRRCNVLPFDTGRTDSHIVQGWMPRLALTGDTFAAVERACAGQKRCTIQFRGTLRELVLSTEELTSLEFADVEIL